MNTTVQSDETVVLIDEKQKKYLISTTAKTDKIKGIGVFDPKQLIDKKYGTQITIGTKQFYLLQPSLKDKLQSIKRKAQIILPRDAAHILMHCAIEPGQHIIEAGIGSGSLTIALASAIQPNGSVISYDIREDFITHATKNITAAQLDHLVTIKNHDITESIDEQEVDAIIIDISTPWKAIPYAYHALKIGGYLCTYSPLISQVERTINQLHSYPFIEIKTLENIQRELITSKHGTRPSYDMLGHTGYLTFARKIIEK